LPVGKTGAQKAQSIWPFELRSYPLFSAGASLLFGPSTPWSAIPQHQQEKEEETGAYEEKWREQRRKLKALLALRVLFFLGSRLA
jgi:hypothetical protein